MITLNMIKHNKKLEKYVFSQGYDDNGSKLKGLAEIGFDTIEIGPTSLMPSCSEQNKTSFGIKQSIANINSFYKQKLAQVKTQQKIQVQVYQPHKQPNIGLCIRPNYEVMKYTPYLIQQNMSQCLTQIQQFKENQVAVSRYVLKFDDKEFKNQNSKQFLEMIKQTVQKCNELLIQIRLQQQKSKDNQRSQTNILHNKQTHSPQLFIKIPNKQQNQNLFNLIVNQIPCIKYIIIDETEYQKQERKKHKQNKIKNTKPLSKIENKKLQTKTNNTQEQIQLILGKRRITFEELLKRVIENSL